MSLFKKFHIFLVTVVCVTIAVYLWVQRGNDFQISVEKMKLKFVDKVNRQFPPDLVSLSTHVRSNLSSLHQRVQWSQNYNFTLEDLQKQHAFTIDSPTDVLLFIHIQKTGGKTFDENLVTNLDVSSPCRCRKQGDASIKLRCSCVAADGKKTWLFSRYSTAWMCGVHADLTEWTECLRTPVPDKVEGFHRKRRYLMLTVLRKPTERYVSEFLHVSRGATWSTATLRCNGRSPTQKELPRCFKKSWKGVKLKDFINCPYNLAANRQTRMLANLSLVGCYDTSKHNLAERKNILLESAKNNLKGLAFFGLKEFLNETQYLFQHTFNVKFKQPLGGIAPKTIHDTREYYKTLKLEIQQKILDRNDLDIQLYDFAKQLFFARHRYVVELKARRSNFESA